MNERGSDASPPAANGRIFEFGGFRLDVSERRLTGASARPVQLTARLFDLLVYMLERPGRLLARQALLDDVWRGVVVEENSLSQAVSALRRTLREASGERRYIETVPGIGYRFIAPVCVLEAARPDAAAAPPAAVAGSRPDEAPEDTVEVTEIRDGARLSLDGFTVTAAENTHYSFPPGSDMDKRFDSLSFRFDLPDRSIVYTGDTGPSDAVTALARGADVLVSELIDATVASSMVAPTGGTDAQKKRFQVMKQHLLNF